MAGLTDGRMEKLVIEPASPVGAGTGAELGKIILEQTIFLTCLNAP